MASFPYFEDLPKVVQAKILSFTISHMIDFASIRSLSRSMKDDIIPLIPSLEGKHFIKCCAKTSSGGSFLSDLMDLCYEYEDYLPLDGDSWKFKATMAEDADEYFQQILFPGCTILSIFFLPEVRENDEKKIPNEMEIISQGTKLCHNAKDSMTLDDLKEIWTNIPNQSKILEPISKPQDKDTEKASGDRKSNKGNYKGEKLNDVESNEVYSDQEIFNVIVTLRVPKDDKFLYGFDSWNDAINTGFLRLECVNKWFQDDPEIVERILPQKKDVGKRFRGYFSKKRRNYATNSAWIDVKVPMKIVAMDTEIWRNTSVQPFEASSISFSSTWKKYQGKSVSEGVFIIDGLISDVFRNRMKQTIDRFKEESPIDYHPNSKNVVRDLVHPALYPYVEGISKMNCKSSDVPPCLFPRKHNSSSDNVSSDKEKDFWGRAYERSIYQWLPTYFNILNDGSCHISDYINNIVPVSSHPQLYEILEGLFERILPCIESVYSYVKETSPRIRRNIDPRVAFDKSNIKPIDEKYCPLRCQRLQVITKIVDYELKPGQSYKGVWHVEGMSHEEIVCTAVYILEKDPSLQGGDIAFKRAFHENEATYIFSNITQSRHDDVEDIISNGLLPLGKVEGLDGRLIIFPNSHVHRVTTLRNISTNSSSFNKRRVIVFFLVNPEKRVVSTREVPPQQKEAGGTMTREEALEHRLELMKERKFRKQDWNIRPIELCEH